MRALRRTLSDEGEDFGKNVAELLSYFAPAGPGQAVRAVPGAGLRIPVWLLGSSLHSAKLAATLGLPFAFASHFAPDALIHALEVYRNDFRASATLNKPYVMPCINVIAAESDAEARRSFTSLQQGFINFWRGDSGLLSPPVDAPQLMWSEVEMVRVEHALRHSAVGSPHSVGRWIESFISLTEADEIMVTAQIFDHSAHLRSLEIIAGLQSFSPG
jgi:luciferase family oxidoreductase group 1